jgi:hypothetical protein
VIPVYVFDASLAPRLAQAIRLLLPERDDRPDPFPVHLDITTVSEVPGLPLDSPETVVIPHLAKSARHGEFYVLVTCLAPSKRKHVIQTIRDEGLRAVHLADAFVECSLLTQASRLLGHWEKIVTQSYRLKEGEAISVRANGKCEPA